MNFLLLFCLGKNSFHTEIHYEKWKLSCVVKIFLSLDEQEKEKTEEKYLKIFERVTLAQWLNIAQKRFRKCLLEDFVHFLNQKRAKTIRDRFREVCMMQSTQTNDKTESVPGMTFAAFKQWIMFLISHDMTL